MHAQQGWTQTSGLVQLFDCICAGYEVIYQCTACGAVATVWSGSLLQDACIFSTIIILRHSQFESGSATGECGNGAVIARSIGVLDVNGSRCYSSQLSVIVNSAMNNKTVTCLHDYGISETVIDTLNIDITTGM